MKPKPEKPHRRRPKHPVLLKDSERYRLLFGPYEPPLVKRGFLVDAVRGKVKFDRFTNALIPWPKIKRQGKGGSGGYALCGDLLRALEKEAAPAISHHWGVSRSTVTNWRNALDLIKNKKGRTPGAQRLVNLGVELARLPQSRKRIAAAARGRVLSKKHKSRLFEGIHRGWGERFEARRAEYHRTGRFPKATKSDPWIPEEDQLLAKLPTAELVRVLGRTVTGIQARRIILNIAPCDARNRPWKEEEIKLVGTDTDRAIAKRLGRSLASVLNMRRKVGIEYRSSNAWRAEEDAILGKVADAEAARRLGRSRGAVAHRRRRLGMILVHMEKPRPWTAAEEALLGTDTDAAIAKRIGRTAHSVRAKRFATGVQTRRPGRPWTAEDIALLGTMPDADLAQKLKRSVISISVKRNKLKIPSAKNRRWSASEDKLLGAMPDDEVARRVGREVGSVRVRRAHLHIPTFESRIRFWKRSELDLLGKVSDEEVSRRIGRAVLAVKAKRQALRILPAPAPSQPELCKPPSAPLV